MVGATMPVEPSCEAARSGPRPVEETMCLVMPAALERWGWQGELIYPRAAKSCPSHTPWHCPIAVNNCPQFVPGAKLRPDFGQFGPDSDRIKMAKFAIMGPILLPNPPNSSEVGPMFANCGRETATTGQVAASRIATACASRPHREPSSRSSRISSIMNGAARLKAGGCFLPTARRCSLGELAATFKA